MVEDVRGRWHCLSDAVGDVFEVLRWMWLRNAREGGITGQGLRRGILLGLRETAKSIAAGSELAFGSDSRPCRNNAVSRSPSSNHPSSCSPARCHLPLADASNRQEKHAGMGNRLGVLSLEISDWYRIFL